jgi:thymidylate kinase
VWDIDLRSPKNQEVSDVQDSLDELFDEYQDQIQTVDFRLDTERVKKDITRRTKRFLKLGK